MGFQVEALREGVKWKSEGKKWHWSSFWKCVRWKEKANWDIKNHLKATALKPYCSTWPGLSFGSPGEERMVTQWNWNRCGFGCVDKVKPRSKSHLLRCVVSIPWCERTHLVPSNKEIIFSCHLLANFDRLYPWVFTSYFHSKINF